MTLFLYRHGETTGNMQKRYIGVTDEPLCDAGIRHTRQYGENKSVTLVYTSALARTQETAALWFPRAERIPIPPWNEMDFGVFEGKTYPQLAGDPVYQAWLDSGCEARCPGGESKEDIIRRACDALEAIRNSGTKTLTAVLHGGTIMAIMSRYAFPRRPYFQWRPGHCEGYRLDLETGRWAYLKELP